MYKLSLESVNTVIVRPCVFVAIDILGNLVHIRDSLILIRAWVRDVFVLHMSSAILTILASQ